MTDDLVAVTAGIIAAYVANNSVSRSELPALIASVHQALKGIGGEEARLREPAVPICASVKPDYIVCLEDGRRLKMLKRHLMTQFQLTPEEYRAKWGLANDYPMIAPNYARQRRELAVKIGLGRKPRPAKLPTVPEVPAKRRTLRLKILG